MEQILQTPARMSFYTGDKCFRLVHDGEKVIAFFEAAGTTRTLSQLFCGTREECVAEMGRLNLPAVEAPYRHAVQALPVRISKLSLRRKLRELGLEEATDAFIAADPQRAADYADAQCLYLSDPLLQAAIPLFASAAAKTEEEIRSLLLSCSDTM